MWIHYKFSPVGTEKLDNSLGIGPNLQTFNRDMATIVEAPSDFIPVN